MVTKSCFANLKAVSNKNAQKKDLFSDVLQQKMLATLRSGFSSDRLERLAAPLQFEFESSSSVNGTFEFQSVTNSVDEESVQSDRFRFSNRFQHHFYCRNTNLISFQIITRSFISGYIWTFITSWSFNRSGSKLNHKFRFLFPIIFQFWKREFESPCLISTLD